jgi:hypothetical protein
VAASRGLTDGEPPGEHRPAAPVLDIATISKADDWVEAVLPRFVAHVRAACSGTVRLHLLLLVEAGRPAADTAATKARAAGLFDRVIERPFTDPFPGSRLLAFDALRAGLTTTLGLPELLYLDPDTDVVEDLQGIQRLAPEADLLWAANPLPLQPVLDDLARHGFAPREAGGGVPLVEPGFLYLRRDLAVEFADLQRRFPDVHRFAPGSTYWTMLARTLGPRGVRLPDAFNRTLWDVPAAAATAKSVHFTGQWKRLQPFVEYRRPRRELVIHDHPVPLPTPAPGDDAWPTRPAALAVVALYRDNAAYLPAALERFAAWERSGLPVRYHFLENDSTDGTPALLERFLRGRPGRLTSRRLAVRYERRGTGYDRIMTLARMRNYVVDQLAAESPLHPAEWTLLVDSGIHFPTDILERIFAAAAADSAPGTIGMLTCYTQQLFAADQVPKVGRPAVDMPGFRLADHYYDIYPFQDLDHRNHAPLCAFARCRYCGAQRLCTRAHRGAPRPAASLDDLRHGRRPGRDALRARRLLRPVADAHRKADRGAAGRGLRDSMLTASPEPLRRR